MRLTWIPNELYIQENSGASVQEKRAYIQGYADCIQVLFHMGLLKENEGLKWAEKMNVK